MTWTYNLAGLAAGNQKDIIRFMIGDTISTDPQLADEEISFCFALRHSTYGGAAQACEALASQYSRLADTVTGELHTLYSSKARAYAKRAIDYENYAAITAGPLIYAGGISIVDKLLQDADPDRVSPQFNLGMTDNFVPVPQVGNEVLEGNSGPGIPNS